MTRTSSNGATLGFEQTLWAAADKLHGHLDAAVVLGNEALASMTRELVREVRKSVTVD